MQWIEARLVIGADGRSSRMRSWGAFDVQRERPCLIIAGTIHYGLDLPEDTIQVIGHTQLGRSVLIYPIGAGHFRTYLVHRRAERLRHLSGARDAARFQMACLAVGAPSEWFRSARQVGPLASFEAAASWVEHPYRQGVALIGDAAGTSDPSFGCGLSLTLRDARVLRDYLLASRDWHAAADAYAREHDRYFGAMRRIVGWIRELQYGVGIIADERRKRALPLLAADPSRRPDICGLGPEAPSDETARLRLFGVL